MSGFTRLLLVNPLDPFSGFDILDESAQARSDEKELEYLPTVEIAVRLDVNTAQGSCKNFPFFGTMTVSTTD